MMKCRTVFLLIACALLLGGCCTIQDDTIARGFELDDLWNVNVQQVDRQLRKGLNDGETSSRIPAGLVYANLNQIYDLELKGRFYWFLTLLGDEDAVRDAKQDQLDWLESRQKELEEMNTAGLGGTISATTIGIKKLQLTQARIEQINTEIQRLSAE